jgi:hypothetical protein
VDAPFRLRMSRTALVPVAVLAAWVLRVGVDIGDDGITVRSLIGQRRVPWDELAGIRVARDHRLWLVTTHGTEVRVPVMRARDLPRLAELSGGRIPAPAPPVDQ